MSRRVKRYRVILEGCDDSTRAWVDLTATELAAARRIADALNASSNHGCQPQMEISDDPAHLSEERQNEEGGL